MVTLHTFLLADFFFKLTFSKNCFRNTFELSNCLDPDQARHFVGPDLYPNCLKKGGKELMHLSKVQYKYNSKTSSMTERQMFICFLAKVYFGKLLMTLPISNSIFKHIFHIYKFV